jgi:hypothetical protein
MLFFLPFSFSQADVIISALAVNGSDKFVEKDVQFSLPGEIKPDDVLDAAGFQVDYDLGSSGYILRGKVGLEGKESKTFKIRVRDVWNFTPEEAVQIREEIDEGYKEMGGENKNEGNGELQRQKLVNQLEYVLEEQKKVTGTVEDRINNYRNHAQSLQDIRSRARQLDYWRTDANDPEEEKTVTFKVTIENPTDKTKRLKNQQYLPPEVKPEFIKDLNGYELRFDEKKGRPFIFKEEDIAPKEKKEDAITIRDKWYIPENDIKYLRDQSIYNNEFLAKSPYGKTAKMLTDEVLNYLDLISALQKTPQPDIDQHIGAYRINKERYDKAKQNLANLEKLLARYRVDLEKSKIKNVMQRMQSMKSLARVSQAIFDKKPTVNAAWKIIAGVMIFLGLFSVFHFVTWFMRSAREKKLEDMRAKEEAQNP